MYHNGELLSAKDLEQTPRRTGNLVVEHCQSSNDTRARQARLLADASQPSHDVLPPLIEPELVALKDNRMVLLGYQIQIDSETRPVQKVQQGWVVHLAIAFIRPESG